MKDHDIETLIHYPTPIHKQKCYAELNGLVIPNSEELSSQIVSIPNNILLTKGQQEYLVHIINQYHE